MAREAATFDRGKTSIKEKSSPAIKLSYFLLHYLVPDYAEQSIAKVELPGPKVPFLKQSIHILLLAVPPGKHFSKLTHPAPVPLDIL